MESSDPLLLTPLAASRRLSLARSTLYELMLTGQIVSVKIGRARRIPVAALNDYIDRLVREQGA